MAIVIADTSPLQYLFQLCDELRAGRALRYNVPEPADYSWISIRPTGRPMALDRFALGAGEHAVLALALEFGECLVLLDDAAARAAAEQLSLPVTGTLGVLLLAKQRGLIAQIAQVLADLERLGFRVTNAVRHRVLQLAGEPAP